MPHDKIKLGTGETKFVNVRLSNRKFKNRHPKDKSLRPGDRVKIFSSDNEGHRILEGIAILVQRDYDRSDSLGIEYWEVEFDSNTDSKGQGNRFWRVVDVKDRIY